MTFGWLNKARTKPPVEPRPDELVILRAPYATTYELFVPSGDSFYLKPDELRNYLRSLGCLTLIAEFLADYVWSHHGLWVGTVDWSYSRIGRQDAVDALRAQAAGV